MRKVHWRKPSQNGPDKPGFERLPEVGLFSGATGKIGICGISESFLYNFPIWEIIFIL